MPALPGPFHYLPPQPSPPQTHPDAPLFSVYVQITGKHSSRCFRLLPPRDHFFWPLSTHCILGTLKYQSCSVSPLKTFQGLQEKPTLLSHTLKAVSIRPSQSPAFLIAAAHYQALSLSALIPEAGDKEPALSWGTVRSGGRVTEEGGTGDSEAERALSSPGWIWSVRPQAWACRGQ